MLTKMSENMKEAKEHMSMQAKISNHIIYGLL